MVGKRWLSLAGVLTCAVVPTRVFGMHIAEGFLQPGWSLTWFLVVAPFVLVGLYSLKRKNEANPRVKLYLGIAGGFVFVLSALKLPSVAGSSSHLTGTGLGTLLFGPWAMAVISIIALLFQALLLAHGGITTLGANAFSMGVAGPLVAYMAFVTCKRAGMAETPRVFLAAFVADLVTYLVTSLQLALAHPDEVGGVWVSMVAFSSVFAFTQVPLACVEGLITVFAYRLIKKNGGISA